MTVRVTPASSCSREARPGLSWSVRSFRQAPQWSAERRAGLASPRRVARCGHCWMRLSALRFPLLLFVFFFVVVVGKPRARARRENDVPCRHCERSEAIQFCGRALDCFVASLLAMTRLRMRRENEFLFSPLPACGERSSEARVRGPLRESERCNSKPSGKAPSSRPSPRARGEGAASGAGGETGRRMPKKRRKGKSSRRGLFWKRRTPDDKPAGRDVAFAAIRQLYIESLPLWRVCPRGSCRRHQCCLEKTRSCLKRGWPLLPADVQLQAYQEVTRGGPRRLPPATHSEWGLRRYAPTNFVL
jgi:hypothetical protein